MADEKQAGARSGKFRWFYDNADGTFGEAHAAENRVWDVNSLSWVKETQPSGGAGGGATTIADGGDVAQGSTSDVAWVSGSGTLIAISKAEHAKLEAIRALLAGSLTVNVGLTDTQIRATPLPVSGTVATGGLTDSQLRATPVPVSGTVTASGPLTDTQLRASAVPVSLATAPSTPVTGTFWQGTQPVSLATAPTTPVTGTFFQATQPVSAAALPLPTGAATSASQSAVKTASTPAAATDTSQVVQQSPMRADAANLCVTNTAGTGVACTLTIPSAGAGLFHYISLIEIQLYATTARTGGATPVLVTTTNLPGSPVWDFDTAQALGATIRQTTQPATPIKSSVSATATTIVAPIATTGIWRITAYYFAAP